MLKQCLSALDKAIDANAEDTLWQEWCAFTDDQFDGDVFSPRRSCTVENLGFPKVGINPALDDFDLMALQQYGTCANVLQGGVGGLMNVRCNYGSSILPSLFGVEIFIMDDELDTLPTSWPLNSDDAIQALLDNGIPDMRAGYGGKVFEMGERFTTFGEQYPNIGQYIHIYHPDIQGPMDVAEVLWGSALMLKFYEAPDLVHALLELITETYIGFMREWEKIVPFKADRAVHWSMMHKGHIMLRDDSAMNLSPEMFDEFVKPYDQRLLDEFGGGAIHFCGRGEHYIASMSDMDNLHAINMTQPEYNNLETIFSNTVDKGIKLLGLTRDACNAAERPLRGQVHTAG